jgi:hypothetical protein
MSAFVFFWRISGFSPSGKALCLFLLCNPNAKSPYTLLELFQPLSTWCAGHAIPLRIGDAVALV